MQQSASLWLWWFKRLGYLVIAALICTCLLGVVLTQAEETPIWATPPAQALKKVSALPVAQRAPNVFVNLDCTPITYRMVASSTMQTGCFTQTAFGWLDSDSGVAIYHGTDEGLPLLNALSNQVIAPWPRAVNLVSLHSIGTGGSSLHLYKNPLGVLQDQRNLLLQLTAKRLTAPPDLSIKDALGQSLIINSQTLAFSDGGSWLVAETLSGAFVRINLATLDIVAFAPAYGAQGHPGLLRSHIAVSDDGKFVAISNDTADAFRVYDLSTCGAARGNLQPRDCQSHDYRPFIRGQLASIQSVRHVRFMNDGLLTFSVMSADKVTEGVYALAPQHSIDSLLDYLALGDSFTSGEGAFNYRAGTDTADNGCHSSVHAYPVLITQDLFSARGGQSVACSGARILDIGNLASGYRGQVRGVHAFGDLQSRQPQLLSQVTTDFLPGYIAQARFARQYQPGIITVSVGGNDIGFGDIIERCAVPRASIHRSDGDCFNTYEDRLEVLQLVDRTVQRWANLYQQLQASAPQARIFVIGYPRIVDSAGRCELNVQLSKSELEFAETLTVYLNSRIKRAADRASVRYIDISDALKGHRLCEARGSARAVNGLTAGKDVGALGIRALGKESYHPNALGQELMKQAILRQTQNFATTTPPASTDDGGQALLTVPRTGRGVVVRSPELTMINRWVPPSTATTLEVDGAQHGLKANTAYAIKLDGPTGPSVATTQSDPQGNIVIPITLPATTAPGSHTVDVIGDSQAGQPTDVTQPIYVPAHPDDADGDTIPNPSDTCPTVRNSQQDEDQDGIDDACDGQITEPAQPVSLPSQGNSQIEAPAARSTGQSSPRAQARIVTAHTTGTQRSAPQSPQISQAPTQKTISAQNSANAASLQKQCSCQAWSPHWWLWLLLAVLLWLTLVVTFFYLKRPATRKNVAANA